MGLYGFLWGTEGLSMGRYESLWALLVSMGLYGALRVSLWGTVGLSMEHCGSLCGAQWVSMGSLWGTVGPYGALRVSMGALWGSMGLYGALWVSL